MRSSSTSPARTTFSSGPENLARAIKTTVKNELSLPCTVGIGPNLLIAKLASDLAKPDGLRWIDEETIAIRS